MRGSDPSAVSRHRGLPTEVEEALDRGVLCYLAVRTRHGPHLTPVVFVEDGGRLWVTTARSSAKSRAWAADPAVAVLVPTGGPAVALRGRARTYDALDPATWARSVARAPRLASAAVRFSLKNARFFAGYAIDARHIPLAWTPPGRVFVELRLRAGRVAAEDGAVVSGWGPWPTSLEPARTYPPKGGPAADLLEGVPPSVRRAVGESGVGALAVDGPEGLSVVPVRWRRGDDGRLLAALTSTVAELAGLGPKSRVALTLDRASAWRASSMTGLLVQGWGRTFVAGQVHRGARALSADLAEVARAAKADAGPAQVLVDVRPERAVWWRGWSSGTVRPVSGGPSR
jgi:hypothetical protein